MPKLHVIIASTRPGRVGLPIGSWFFAEAQKHAKFEVSLVDLAKVNLPFLDEPEHPRFQRYQHAHTKAWSATIAAADAFVFVTPEYNYFAPAALVNAIDFLFLEWQHKPCAFVSYGGISSGLRSVQALKPLVTSLKMMPLPEAVAISFPAKHLQEGVFTPETKTQESVAPMLDELHRWAEALRPLRVPR